MSVVKDFVVRLSEAETAATSGEGTPPAVIPILEALLFAGGQPINADVACSIIRGLSAADFDRAVEDLARCYRRERRPYSVQKRSDGWVLALKPAYQQLRDRLVPGPREARLSLPALDVLAVVAYRQPVTRNEIDTLRGHDSAPLLRQLVRLNLIAVENCGQYGTTGRFLELFGLQSLDDLPRTMDLQKI